MGIVMAVDFDRYLSSGHLFTNLDLPWRCARFHFVHSKATRHRLRVPQMIGSLVELVLAATLTVLGRELAHLKNRVIGRVTIISVS